MCFHHKLKQLTKNYHAHIERVPLLKKIVESNISLNEYLSLIKRFYGYIMPCEALIHNLPCHSILANRGKTLLLENDLLELGVYNTALKQIIRCMSLPILKEYEHVLGYLYVIEGSTLGGQVITKILQKNLQLTPHNGARYFNSYGKNTNALWHKFCHILNNITESEPQNMVITSANLTYTTLYNWMSTPEEE